MAEAGVTLRCGCRVKEITAQGVVVINQDTGEELIEGDQIISALGQTPNRELADKLREKYFKKTIFVGDCVKAAKSGDAIRDGLCAALSIN